MRQWPWSVVNVRCEVGAGEGEVGHSEVGSVVLCRNLEFGLRNGCSARPVDCEVGSDVTIPASGAWRRPTVAAIWWIRAVTWNRPRRLGRASTVSGVRLVTWGPELGDGEARPRLPWCGVGSRL
ncbi:ryanodine receptor 2 [Striga asiatica]|uniref:Ryanodine receptor 2 n=1 Tax=Striga asiatica TaxID=4170 RepID=A0A5A7PUF5_STRAF|nr:ryanodine receptor 2 [Striga asiatica]